MERAFRRGVEDEVLLDGYYAALPLSRDQEVVTATMPQLFDEELDEHDISSETVGAAYLRSEAEVVARVKVLSSSRSCRAPR
mmetsp:Transcript_12072/g.27992  ORF Transcript_12072/g.27992 Transcript_12072/m.27992 type:complete len:82 (-) Transcript_12072:351-596(-)